MGYGGSGRHFVVSVKPQFILIIFIFVLTSGCQLGYITKSAHNQALLMQSRVSFEYALKNYDLTNEQREKIQLTIQVRDFMEASLGLNVGRNFTRYVHLDRDSVTYAVNAAYKNRLQAYKWNFPMIGSVPYKGYFDKDDALTEADSLKKQNLDTYVRGVSAYSTLGWYEDPLLSSMLKAKEHRLVNTLIHETVHSNLYIAGHSKFNERVATFLGMLGAEAFYKQRNQGAEYKSLVEKESHDESLFSAFITKELKNLKSWFKVNKDDKDILNKREKQYQQMKNRFAKNVIPKMKTNNYQWFTKRKFNNAFLLLLDLYNSDFASLEKLSDQYQRDFKKTFAKLKELEDAEDPEVLLQSWVE